MITFETICEDLSKQLSLHCQITPRRKFDITVDIEGQDGIFYFRGSVDFYDNEIKGVSLGDCGIEYSNFNTSMDVALIGKIEDYFNR